MKKILIRAIIFVAGVFLFLLALLPRYFGSRYDSKSVDSPSVVVDGENLRMYYTGYHLNGTGTIAIATSEDGKIWKKSKANPVLKKSLAKYIDSYSVSDASVIKVSDEYKMWYIGTTYDGERSVCLATSKDGIRWEKHKNNPVFSSKRPVPTKTEVATWSDERVDECLADLDFSDDFFNVDKKIWLSECLSLLQRPIDANYYPLLAIKGLAMVKFTLPSVAPKDKTLRDLPNLRARLEQLLSKGKRPIPSWEEVAAMSEDEVKKFVSDLGISEENFRIDKRDWLITIVDILDKKIPTFQALNYLKVAFRDIEISEASRRNMPQIYRF